MQAWVVAMVVVVAVALALTVYGALHDRSVNRRRAAEMLGPPARDIPHLPADARPPAYVTEAQARRRPETASTAPRRPRGGAADGGVEGEVQVAVGYASADFVTDPAGREAVVEDALVLVCADDVETVRELLPVLELALRAGQPLVVVAPVIAREVLGTLEVNAIQGRVPGVAVLGDDDVRAQVARASGATPVDRADLRSGWISPDALGHVARWSSTATLSRLLPASRVGAPE